MSENDLWFLLGHLVCMTQWVTFVQVHWAYMGKARVRYPLVYAIGMILVTFSVSVYFKVEFFSVPAVLLCIAFLFWSSSIFEGSLTQKFTSSLVGGIMALLTQNTVRCIASWLTKRTLAQMPKSAGFLLVMIVVEFVVGICVAYFVRRWSQRSALEPLQALVMSFFPCVAVLLNVILMISMDENEVATPLYLFLMPGLTLAVLVHLMIMVMFNDQVVRQRALSFQAELEQQRAEALLESYTAQRHLTHEFTNHMNAIDVLLEQEDPSAAREYIASISKIVAAGTTVLNTHNPLLDSLLSKQYESAAQQGVRIFFDMCDLQDLPFAGTDLVIVVSNVLDNAVRAAAKADPPEVYIRARKTEDEYIVSVRNRVEQDVELLDGQLPRSTKKEPGHGMGLSNVQETLEKYQGELTLTCRDRWFRFTCVLPNGKV